MAKNATSDFKAARECIFVSILCRLRRRFAQTSWVPFSANDWVLAIIARLHTLISTRLSFGVAGLQAIQVGAEGEVVENIDLSDLLNGHLELGPKMTEVLERIGMEK